MMLSDLSEETISEIYFAITKTTLNSNANSYSIAPAAKPGEGFLSDIYKLKICGESANNRSFYIKVLTKNERMLDSIPIASFFKREVFFYNRVLPAFRSVQKSAGAIEDFQTMVPHCVKAFSDGENDYLVLKDLTEEGYESPSKRDGLNPEQAYKAVEVLAKLHAMSFAMAKLDPVEFKKLCDEIESNYYIEKNRKLFESYTAKTLRIWEEVLRLEEGIQSETYEKFASFCRADCYGRIVQLAETTFDHCVIGNGDAWSPNFMFSDKGIVLLDFQLVRVGSPVLDLLFTIYSSISHEILLEHFENLLQSYYRIMGIYLDDMNIQIKEVFPLHVFQAHMRQFGAYGIAASMSTILLGLEIKYESTEIPIRGDCDDDSVIPLTDIFEISVPQDKYGRERIVAIAKHAIMNKFV